MQPYYQDATTTLYLGDSRDVLPTLGEVAAKRLQSATPPLALEWRESGDQGAFDAFASA